jgi:putative transposase
MLAFGKVNFDRGSIPEHIRDLSSWPTVDLTALNTEDQVIFIARRSAIELYVDNAHISLVNIKKQTGVEPRTLYRMMDRCLTKHPDGRIYGFRAAIPYARLKVYERIHSIDRQGENGGGLAGAFSLLLARYPSIEKFLKQTAKERHRKIDSVREVRKSIHVIHKSFLVECRNAGVKQNEYPFNQNLIGIRSLASYFERYDNKSFSTAATRAGAARVGASIPSEMEQVPAATRPFEVIEFDGHKIDLRITVKILDPFGFETLLELHRVWILVLLDVASRAVIGYSLALGKEYNKDDVAAALQSALVPFRSREYRIPGLHIRNGGGFPSSIIPETQYACWDWFSFDGAKSHLAADTLIRLNQVVGCWTDNGPAAEPDVRPFIERFFQLITKNFAHRLPGTTGSNPQSIEKVLSDTNGNISLLVELSELEDMIEVLLADYNAEPHGGLGSRTPLEAMAHLVAKNPGYIRMLPRVMRTNLCLLQEARVVPIKGSLANGVRPHINFSEVKYTNDVLSSNPELLGKKLRIYYDIRDIRIVKAFFEDGAELGILTAARPWCYTPHSLRVRQEIFRLKRQGKLKYRDGDDPVEAWVKSKRAQAKSNKRAANDLAKAQTNLNTVKNEKLVTQLEKKELDILNMTISSDSESEVKKDNRAIQPDNEIGAAPSPRLLKIRRTFIF